MKRIIALFLFLLIMGGAMHFDEAAKLPFLVSHYREHKAKDTGYTFLAFLYTHYILNDNHVSKDHRNRHAQLPFKSTQSLQPHYSAFIFEIRSVQITFNLPVNIFIPFNDTKTANGFFDIWQPPKLG